MGILHEIRVGVFPGLMNSRGLNTDPWRTTILTSNSSLKEMLARVLLLAHIYMACTSLTNHSGTPTTRRAHHSTFRGTLSKAFPNQQMPCTVSRVFRDTSLCCTSTWAEPKLHFISVNCATYDVFDHSFSSL